VSVVQSYHNPPYPTRLRGSGAFFPRGTTITLATGTHLALGLVLALAFALRFWGLAFGLPYVIQPDEPSVERRALLMWLHGDLNPHYFIYPSLDYDLQAAWAWAVGHAAGLFAPDVPRHPWSHQPVYYFAGRLLTALLGTLTVLVTYLTGRLLSPRLGLTAALFLAVAAQHVQQSHYITVDAPTALFTAMTAYFALRALRRQGQGHDIALAGIAAGLAAGVKYNAGIALALPLVAILLWRGRPWPQRAREAAVATALCALTFLLTTPYAVLDHVSFLRDLRTISMHYTSGHPGAEGSGNAVWYIAYLGATGLLPPLTLLALSGLGVVVARYRRAGLVLLAFVVPYYVLLCSTVVRFDRNLLPLLPFAALLAAASAEAIVPPLALRLRNHVAASIVVLGVAAAPSAYAAGVADFTVTHPFSEQVAVAWADAHLPRGARVAIENWEGDAFAQSSHGYRIEQFSSLAAQTYDRFRAQGFRYLVADSWTDGAFLSAPARYPLQVARYRKLYRRARLLVRITGAPPARPGPTMSIYEVR